MPQIPSISAPVSGSSFYTPGKEFLQKGQTSSTAAEEKQQTQSLLQAEAQAALTDNASVDLSGLTAQDLTQLARSGSIGGISSLLGGNALYGNSGLTNRLSSSDAAANKALLQEILKELKEIKKSQSGQLASAATGTKPSALPPKILRFMVNASDVLSKCTQVYFSEREADGTFLLTGDARTLFGNETVSETFYLLFKAAGTKNSKTVYEVSATLSQSKTLETPLNKFCSAENYSATRVGNLVTLRSIENSGNSGNSVDLLLDIGEVR